jgi:hypothetical protein
LHFKNIFVRACDDAIVIKGLERGNPTDCAPNENLFFEQMQLWSDCNNAMELGCETRAKYYRNIHFKDVDVLFSYDDKYHHEELEERSVMNICCLEGTYFSNISWEDIRVNRCERLIGMTFNDTYWFGSILGDQTTPGGIDGVSFKNIRVDSNSGSRIANEIRLDGWYREGTPTKTIRNITFDNVVIEGKKVSSADQLVTNSTPSRPLVSNLSFK